MQRSAPDQIDLKQPAPLLRVHLGGWSNRLQHPPAPTSAAVWSSSDAERAKTATSAPRSASARRWLGQSRGPALVTAPPARQEQTSALPRLPPSPPARVPPTAARQQCDDPPNHQGNDATCRGQARHRCFAQHLGFNVNLRRRQQRQPHQHPDAGEGADSAGIAAPSGVVCTGRASATKPTSVALRVPSEALRVPSDSAAQTWRHATATSTWSAIGPAGTCDGRSARADGRSGGSW
jgi:hypothetical protein